MTDKVFVDTTILIYARDLGFPEKQKICKELLARLWENRTGRLSVQVCNEFYGAVTKSPGAIPLSSQLPFLLNVE